MEQLADVVHMVQILDIPVPQMVDQCPRSRRHPVVLARLSESRRRRNIWWKRQLSSLSWMSIELTVDIPVGAGGGSGCGGHQGFLPGQISSPTVEQIVDTPPPRSSSGFGCLQGLHPGQSSTAVAEQNVDIRAPRGVF